MTEPVPRLGPIVPPQAEWTRCADCGVDYAQPHRVCAECLRSLRDALPRYCPVCYPAGYARLQAALCFCSPACAQAYSKEAA